MRIAGIDASLTATGLVLLDDGRTEAADWTLIKSTRIGVARVAEIAEACCSYVRRAEAQVVAIEDYSYTARFTQAYSLGELGGILRYLLWKHGIGFEVWSTATIRKALTGKGNLPKSAMPLEAYKRFHVEFSSPDVLDAWSVAMTAHLFRQPTERLLAYQVDAFKTRRAA